MGYTTDPATEIDKSDGQPLNKTYSNQGDGSWITLSTTITTRSQN